MKKLNRLPASLLPCLLCLLVACASGDEAPDRNLAPSSPTEEQPSATRPADLTPETPVQPTPERTANVAVDAAPPQTPSPAPTAIPLAIERPVPGSRLIAGSRVSINGRAQPQGDDHIALAIRMGPQEIFSEDAQLDVDGYWGGVFTVPENIAGPATLFAANSAGEQVSIPIEIHFDERAEGPLLTLKRPAPGDLIVAGYIVFFEGFIRDPVDQTLTFSVLSDNCTNAVASFELSIRGGNWWGHLLLPANSVAGPACAMVITSQGAEAGSNWREVSVPVTLIDAANPEATSIYLGVPGELVFKAGSAIKLYGGAINAPGNEVQLVLTKDAVGPGALLAQETVSVDAFGYWEVELAPTRNWLGLALLTISMGDEDTYTELRTTLEIER